MTNRVEFPTSYRTSKACSRFMEYIYNDIKQETARSLSNARVLSIMFDGATDVSICENEIVYARFVDNGIPKFLYMKIQDVEHVHAAGVLEAIEKSLDGIQEKWNWKEKPIATGSDGANVNIGRKK